MTSINSTNIDKSIRLLDVLPYPVYIINRDYTIINANRAAGDIPPKSHCFEVSHNRKEPCDHRICPMKKVLQTKEPVVIEHTHVDAAQQTKYIKLHAYPLLNNTGDVFQVMEFATDITQQKINEQKLTDVRKQLNSAYSLIGRQANNLDSITGSMRRLYQDIAIPVLTWQKKGESFILVDYNKANEMITQGKIKDHLGINADQFFASSPDILEDLELSYSQQTTFKRERPYTFVTTNEPKHLVMTFSFIPPDKVNIQSEDVTTLADVEAELRASEANFHNLFLVARDGIIISNKEGTIYDANPAAARILGYATIEELKKTSLEVIYADLEKRRLAQELLLKRGYLEDFEVQFKRKDGKIIDVNKNIILRKDRQGKITQYESIFTDITEQKKVERAIRRRLMRFQVDEGYLYLIKDSVPTQAYEVFRDLLNAGYNGAAISRPLEQDFRQILKGAYTYYQLHKQPDVTQPLMQQTQMIVDKHPRNTAFLFDRLDYFLVELGFRETLRFICWLKDRLYFTGNIGIALADPTLFTDKELQSFTKETRALTIRHHQVPTDLMEILQFIHYQNGLGVQPIYSDVQRHFGISKPTTSKRVQQLVGQGYLQEFRRGNRKGLQLSFEGMQIVTR